jgi:hypothetical protein
MMLCAWLSLPNATPVRAAETVTIGTISKDSIENNESKDYKVIVQKGKQIMIGAINLSLDALSANPTNDLKVTEVSCPGGRVTPLVNGKGESNGGVVYCTPTGSDNYFEVEFKVKNEKGGRVEYAVFVKQLDDTASNSPLTLPDDLQNRLGDVSDQKVKLYSVTRTVGFNQAKFLLQYAPRSENGELQLAARFYSPSDGSAKCSAALLRQSSTEAVATGLPAFTPCDPFSTNNAYLVVVNYVGGEGDYCLYLANNTTTLVVAQAGANQWRVGKVSDCGE